MTHSPVNSITDGAVASTDPGPTPRNDSNRAVVISTSAVMATSALCMTGTTSERRPTESGTSSTLNVSASSRTSADDTATRPLFRSNVIGKHSGFASTQSIDDNSKSEEKYFLLWTNGDGLLVPLDDGEVKREVR